MGGRNLFEPFPRAENKSPSFFPEEGQEFHFPPGGRADFTKGPNLKIGKIFLNNKSV